MKIVFNGVRGTTPVTGREFVKYGGGTSSIIVNTDNKLIFFDAGTGITKFNPEEYPDVVEYYLFLSHFHYDHIQGFPFFAPLFNPNAKIRIYGAVPEGMKSLEEGFDNLIRPPFLPFSLSELPCKILYTELSEGDEIKLSDRLKISNFALIHPNSCLGYKLKYRNEFDKTKIFVYATDTAVFTGDKRSEFIDFLEAADLLVYDGFFTDDELYGKYDGLDKTSWGHSSWQGACKLARDAGIKKLALFHHLHTRKDTSLDEIQRDAKSYFAGAFCAMEGMEMVID